MRRKRPPSKRKGATAARLGNAVYWLGSAFAIVIIGYPFFFIIEEWGNYELASPDPLIVGAYVVGGIAVWLVARAARSMIAGK